MLQRSIARPVVNDWLFPCDGLCSGVSESANEGGCAREGEEEGEDGTEKGLEVKCRGCFAVDLRIGK